MTKHLHAELQDWLDRWANTFLANDLYTFMDMAIKPLSLRSHGAEWMVNDEAEFVGGFNAYRKLVLDNKVDLIVRVLRDVQELQDGDVKVLYENYLMNGTQRMFRPSGAEAYLRRVGNDWKAYRVIEIEFNDPTQEHLPETRADKLHDRVVSERLVTMRKPGDDPGDGEPK